jgi:hypothetical protein
VTLTLLGAALTAAVAGLVWLGWGPAAAGAAATFGAVATAIHLAAVAALKPAMRGPFAQLARRWALGLGLRLGGALVLGAAAVWRPDLFPPLPVAIGYLGVLVPLLFTEIRFLR